MSTFSPSQNTPAPKRQGKLVAFGMTGAMALALAACDTANTPSQAMIVPPNSFNPAKATDYASTNQAPQSPTVFAYSNCSGYLCGHGYFPVYGYPGYYYRPVPGTMIELVRGGSPTYVASSPGEARANVARGGFGGGEGGHSGFGGGE